QFASCYTLHAGMISTAPGIGKASPVYLEVFCQVELLTLADNRATIIHNSPEYIKCECFNPFDSHLCLSFSASLKMVTPRPSKQSRGWQNAEDFFVRKQDQAVSTFASFASTAALLTGRQEPRIIKMVGM